MTRSDRPRRGALEVAAMCRRMCLWLPTARAAIPAPKMPLRCPCFASLSNTHTSGYTVEYKVSVVEDHELPAGTDWVITSDDDAARLLLKRSVFADPERMCALLEDAWVAWNELGRPVTAPSDLAWYQRRRTLASAAGVAAALVVAVPSPVAAVYHG